MASSRAAKPWTLAYSRAFWSGDRDLVGEALDEVQLAVGPRVVRQVVQRQEPEGLVRGDRAGRGRSSGSPGARRRRPARGSCRSAHGGRRTSGAALDDGPPAGGRAVAAHRRDRREEVVVEPAMRGQAERLVAVLEDPEAGAVGPEEGQRVVEDVVEDADEVAVGVDLGRDPLQGGLPVPRVVGPGRARSAVLAAGPWRRVTGGAPDRVRTARATVRREAVGFAWIERSDRHRAPRCPGRPPPTAAPRRCRGAPGTYRPRASARDSPCVLRGPPTATRRAAESAHGRAASARSCPGRSPRRSWRAWARSSWPPTRRSARSKATTSTCPSCATSPRRASEAVVLAAVDDASGDLLGCVTYVPDASNPWAEHLREGEAGIRMLAVDPAGQGRGAGTALVAACLDRARADGRRAVFLHSLPVMDGRAADLRPVRLPARHRTATGSFPASC